MQWRPADHVNPSIAFFDVMYWAVPGADKKKWIDPMLTMDLPPSFDFFRCVRVICDLAFIALSIDCMQCKMPETFTWLTRSNSSSYILYWNCSIHRYLENMISTEIITDSIQVESSPLHNLNCNRFFRTCAGLEEPCLELRSGLPRPQN